MNVKELVNRIHRFEVENKLYENNLVSKAWKSIRTSTYYALQKDLAIFSDVKPRKNLICKVFAIKSVIINSLFQRPKLTSDYKNLVIQHPRTKSIDGLKIDPYSYEFTKNLTEPTLFLSRTSIGEKDKYLNANQASLDWVLILKLFNFRSLNQKLSVRIEEMMISLCSSLNVDTRKYAALFQRAMNDFMVEENYFLNLLKNSGITTVYLVDHYSKNVPLVSACKILNIKVVEFQHGIVSKYHLGYSVEPSLEEWSCYPDVFLSWGEQWLNGVKLPRSVVISYIKPDYLNYVKEVEKKNQLLVVSQSVIGKKIAEYLLKHIHLKLFNSVLFKLHPSEVDLLSYYEHIFRDTSIEVCTGDIYPLLNESKHVLGVFSTVMLEAVDFSCEIFYIDLPGSEYIKSNQMITHVKEANFHV